MVSSRLNVQLTVTLGEVLQILTMIVGVTAIIVGVRVELRAVRLDLQSVKTDLRSHETTLFNMFGQLQRVIGILDQDHQRPCAICH